MSNFNNQSRLIYDKCYIRSDSGKMTINQITNVKEPVPHVYDGINYGKISNERVLASELTNKREQHQLSVRPYLGSYRGSGTHTTDIDNINIESALIQGVSTKLRNKTNEPVQGSPQGRFECLPEYGNPQRTQYIIPPMICEGGWIRGGADTRDYVRRVDYYRRCALGKKY